MRATSSYRERASESPLIVCAWEQVTAAPREQRVLPDACVDLLWRGERLLIAGPDSRARLVALAAGERIVGVRLRPGVAGAVLGLPAGELRDGSPDAGEVIGRAAAGRLLDALLGGAEPHALLAHAIARRGAGRADPLVVAAVLALGRPRVRVAELARELGVSARQLQRRVGDGAGLGPKALSRVLRLHRLRTLPPAPLAELALDAGYADQAHMTAEVTQLAGIPPVRFLKDWASRAA